MDFRGGWGIKLSETFKYLGILQTYTSDERLVVSVIYIHVYVHVGSELVFYARWYWRPEVLL